VFYVIYLCEDLPSPLQEDSSEVYLILACLSIAVVALIVIAVICLKRKSYGEWKSMDIPSLGT
jgi:hypothetical protein